MAAFVLTDTQEVVASVAFTDKAGNPAQVDGPPVWSSSDETVLTVAADPDGLSATATATGKLGTAQLLCKADALVGDGIEELVLTGDIEVVASKAVAGSVTFGAATEKP